MKSISYVIFLALVLISLGMVSATVESLPTQKKGDSVNLIQSCAGSTYSNITKILYPNSSFALRGEYSMNKLGFDYNYSFNDTQTLGQYLVYGHCDESGTNTYWVYDFEVTYTGDSLDTSKSIMYAVLLALLVFFFILIIYFTGNLPESKTRNEEGNILSISSLKYLGATLIFVDWLILTSIFYISSSLAFAYLGETLFANILFTIFQICFGLTLPMVVVWFIWIIANIVQDKKINKLITKGIYPNQL